MATEEDEARYQSFKRGESRAISIEAFYHIDSCQHVVYWGDILDALPNDDSIVVMKETRVVSRARDKNGRLIEPRCIKYHHGVVLEVVNDIFSPEIERSYSPLPISRSATPDVHLNWDLNTRHSRTASSASSHLTVETAYSSHANAKPISVGGSTYLMSPPYTNNTQSNSGNKEHGRNSSDLDSQDISPPVELSAPVFTPHTESSNSTDEQWTTSTAGGLDSRRRTSISTSSDNISYFPPWHPSNASNDSHPAYSYNEGPHTPPIAITTAVVRVARTPSSTQTTQFMQRMQSTVQSFEQYIQEGQLMQAKVVQQEAESIKKDMAQYYGSLQTEVAKNTTLQSQVKDMVAASEKMTKRILELQEAQLDTDKMMLLLQQQALDRLALIHSKATAILTQTYELHEFPIPRLFIILPKEDITKREKIGTIFVKRFRLYFLCECGEHTRPVDGPPSSLSHDIHLARHEGYDLDRPNEFFRKYGSYVLALLQMLKYGVVAAGMVVPPLNAMKIADELAVAEAGLKAFEKDFAPRVDSAIEYLQGLTAAQESVSKDLGNSSSTTTLVDPVSIGRLEGLEGADLRHLGSFLKASDEGKVLGNLYRTVTPQGHVKWVCLDHYRESYGAAALQEFKEMVELSGGKYDQRTGRVTMRLASPILAKQFYTMLLSTRLVHELELSLDWNTSFEDLRILKGVMQQSNVFHLGLNLCGKTGPTSDFVYRNRRAEPIVQIMASGKMHTMSLKGTTSFLSQTKDPLKTATLHVRHLDLGENVASLDDFNKLEKLIRASPMLVRLGVMLGNIDQAFERLKPIVAGHKSLSILDLQLLDGTAALIHFEQGSNKVRAIGLKVVDPNRIRTTWVPFVTSVVLLAKNTVLRTSEHVHSFVKLHRSLKTFKIVQMPDGSRYELQTLCRDVDNYCGKLEEASAVAEEGASIAVVDEGHVDIPKGRPGFMKLHSIYKRTVLWNMALLIASVEETEAQKETATAPEDDNSMTRSIFVTRREDGSLVSVRFELEDEGSMVLHFDDFNASEVFQHTPATKLTVIGNDGFELLSELVKEPAATQFGNLRTLEFGSRRRDLLDILRHFQQAATHYPTLTQLNLWSVNNETMNGFTLPLRELDLSDHDVSIVQLPTLRHLLQSAFTLSRLTLSVPCFSEVFDIVTSAAQLNKQLSHVQLNKQLSHVQLNKQLSHVQLGEAASRLSAQFIVGTGEVHSISLRILESQVEKLRSLPKITELKILYGREVSRIQPLVLSIFTHYRQLKVFSMDYLPPDLLESIDAVHQAAIETSTSCQVIFTNVNPNSSFQPTVFELPLKSLVIPSTVIDEDKSFKIVQHLIGSSPSLQELELTVASVNVAQRIFDFIIEKRRPMPMLSLRLQEGPTAVFSLEPGKVGDGLMVAQQIAHADLSKTFPLSVTLERIDVVGGHLSISNVVGIALSVMRCRQEIQTFRFMDCPQQIKDIAIAIKDSFQREADSSTPERMQVQQIAFKSNSPTSTPFGLALICASHDDTQNGQSLDPTSKERVSLVLRKQQHGVLEAIGLDCSDPDGITLRLNPVAFNKSDIVLLSNVTNLTVSISSGSTLIEDFVRKPIRIFSHLKSLELSCDHSLQPRVLLTALEEAGHRPTLEQLHIWHPDNLSERLTYDLPIKTLDLTQCAIHPRDLRGLETIPASNLSLSRLTLNVPSLLAAFKFVRSNVGKLGSLTQLHLHGVDKTELTVLFKAGMGGMTSVTLTLKDLQRAISQETAPVLMMIQLSDPTLELICAIQDARLDNPDLQCLVLREGGADLEVKIEIPMRKIDLGESVLTQQQISSLKRLPAMCPQLMEFQMTVAPFPDLHEACRVLGPRFQALKTLSSFRLRLENGIVASIRFSKDGIIRSVALRIPEECVDERVKIPLVKQVSICPKRASRWLGAEHMKQELSKVLELYPEIETLELDGDVCGPLSVLLYLQEQAKTYGWRPLRYYRHRASETSEALITHNLPLRKLQLEEYVMSLSELSELETLLLDSPWISEAAITVASSAMIDSVDKRLKGCDQLEALTINSSDGYTMMLQWIGGTPASSYYYKPRLFKASDFQVSGTEWPLCFDRYRTPKLTILIDSMVSSTNEAPLSGTDANNTIHAILSKSHPGLVDLTHLALICPPHQFFGFLPKVLSFINITRIDLQDSFDSQTIISTVTGSGRVVGTTFSLDKISDHDLLDTFCSAFSESQLRAAMINVNANGHPHINVAFDLLDKEDEKQVSGQIQWDAYNVSSRRVFELLDTVRARSKAKTELEFRVIWRPSVRSFRTGAGNVLRPYSDIWDDAETMAKLVKLLVWRASHFDIEYETMKLLIPFVKAEAEINPLKRPQEEPFSLLRHYDIRVVDSAVVSEVIQEFNSLIRREVSHIIHDDSEIDVLSSHS